MTQRARYLPAGSVSLLAGVCILAFTAGAPLLSAQSLEDGRLLAQLVPQRYTTLSSELSARISELSVREGDRFRAGDVLIRLDCDLQRAQRERAVAQREAAQAAHDANQQLSELAAVGSVELATSAAELAVANAEIHYLDVTLDKCRITAPWDGAAGALYAREYAFVQAGQPILDLHDPTALQVEFIVPTAWLAWFKPDYRFELFVEELDRDIALILRSTAARADPVSQSVKAIADIEDNDSALIAGMSGYLRVEAPTEIGNRGN